MTNGRVEPPFDRFLVVAEEVGRERPEVDLEMAREVFQEVATLLYNGLALDGLEDAGLPGELGEEKVVIDVELDEDTALVWLKTFTDLRLALATRLEVEQGDEAFWSALPDDDPRSQAHDIYEWIGALQETLVDALR